MSEAIVVHEIYKQFGKPQPAFWERLLRQPPANTAKDGGSNARYDKGSINGADDPNGGNGNNGNGANTPAVVPPLKGVNGKNANRKTVVAVDHVTFTVHTGEIFGVLGPNGGGKSTLIRLISTLLLPDHGYITVFGYDVVHQSMAVQRIINRVSVEASFFKKLSPMENLIYGARLYGLEGRDTRKQVVEILTRLGLEKRAIFNPMEEMSRGMQQKVAIARALLTRPRLLLLDEPTTGLDPRSKQEVQAVVRELRDTHGTTILLTTHDMIEAETLCDRIAIMDSGKVMALDTPAALKKLVPPKNGQAVTLEEVFLELTGKKLVNKEEEEEIEVEEVKV